MILETDMDIGGYNQKFKVELVAGEVTQVWWLDTSFSPANLPPEWVSIHKDEWPLYERPILDFVANYYKQKH